MQIWMCLGDKEGRLKIEENSILLYHTDTKTFSGLEGRVHQRVLPTFVNYIFLEPKLREAFRGHS